MSQLANAATALQAQGALPAGIDLQKLLGPLFWRWYHHNSGVTLLKISRKILVIPVTVTFKVKDCRLLFELLFGTEPPEVATDWAPARAQ